MIKAIIFDLDDTLYDECDFVRSGFDVVAGELAIRGAGSRDTNRAQLESIHFCEGRENVFDKAAILMGFPPSWIPELVFLFRNHSPRITLDASTTSILNSLKSHYKLGCITDGWAEVQRRKLDRLGLERFMDAIVVCDDFGREFWKPHVLPFQTCCELLGVLPAEALYIGDNPDRDIRGALGAGIKCVHIRRPHGYPFGSIGTDSRADAEITELEEIDSLIQKMESVTNET